MTVEMENNGNLLGSFHSVMLFGRFWWKRRGPCHNWLLVSLPCFYIILYWKKNNAYGRFILLTYNLTALYSYSMAQKDSEDGYEGEATRLSLVRLHSTDLCLFPFGIVWVHHLWPHFSLPNRPELVLKIGTYSLVAPHGRYLGTSDPLDYRSITWEKEATLWGIKDFKKHQELACGMPDASLSWYASRISRLCFPSCHLYEKLLASTSAISRCSWISKLMVEVDSKMDPDRRVMFLEYISNERSELEHRIFWSFTWLPVHYALGF